MCLLISAVSLESQKVKIKQFSGIYAQLVSWDKLGNSWSGPFCVAPFSWLAIKTLEANIMQKIKRENVNEGNNKVRVNIFRCLNWDITFCTCSYEKVNFIRKIQNMKYVSFTHVFITKPQPLQMEVPLCRMTLGYMMFYSNFLYDTLH